MQLDSFFKTRYCEVEVYLSECSLEVDTAMQILRPHQKFRILLRMLWYSGESFSSRLRAWLIS